MSELAPNSTIEKGDDNQEKLEGLLVKAERYNDNLDGVVNTIQAKRVEMFDRLENAGTIVEGALDKLNGVLTTIRNGEVSEGEELTSIIADLEEARGLVNGQDVSEDLRGCAQKSYEEGQNLDSLWDDETVGKFSG